MAKVRIGHIAEARRCRRSASTTSTSPKCSRRPTTCTTSTSTPYKVPFVCGARDLGEALRRIAEGAAMIRSKGEAGRGNIVEAVRHMRAIRDGIATLRRRSERRARRARARSRRAARARARDRDEQEAAGRAVLRRRRFDAGRRRADDGARRRRHLRRQRHLQIDRTRPRSRARSSTRRRTGRTPTSCSKRTSRSPKKQRRWKGWTSASSRITSSWRHAEINVRSRKVRERSRSCVPATRRRVGAAR